VTADELNAISFPAGSMGPKVAAATRFATRTGKRAAIGYLEDLDAIVRGAAGTNVVAEAVDARA
jgi:carbamate kinase